MNLETSKEDFGQQQASTRIWKASYWNWTQVITYLILWTEPVGAGNRWMELDCSELEDLLTYTDWEKSQQLSAKFFFLPEASERLEGLKDWRFETVEDFEELPHDECFLELIANQVVELDWFFGLFLVSNHGWLTCQGTAPITAGELGRS